MDDLDVQPTAPVGMGQVDPMYQQVYGGASAEVAPRRVGFPVVPPFLYYIVKPLGAKVNRTKANVGARATVQILEGPADTVGTKVSDNGAIWFDVSRNKKDRQGNVLEVLDDAKYAQKVKNHVAALNRIRQALGLAYSWPQGSTSDSAVEAYCKLFDSARSFVVEIRIERDNNGIERNRIVWESAAGLDEPVLDKNDKPIGKTAAQEAREKIAAFGKAAASKTSGTSASLAQGDLR